MSSAGCVGVWMHWGGVPHINEANIVVSGAVLAALGSP